MTRAPLTPEQRAEIRACAEAAQIQHPGPLCIAAWTNPDDPEHEEHDPISICDADNDTKPWLTVSGWHPPAYAPFIARMDPQTTIALLDALDEAERGSNYRTDEIRRIEKKRRKNMARVFKARIAEVERERQGWEDAQMRDSERANAFIAEMRRQAEVDERALAHESERAKAALRERDEARGELAKSVRNTEEEARQRCAEMDALRWEVERLRLNSKIEQDATNCHMAATAKYQRREAELVGHLRTLIGEIDEWESAVTKIIERPPDCPWKSLEVARAAIGGGE